jgi:hypothetical protein
MRVHTIKPIGVVLYSNNHRCSKCDADAKWLCKSEPRPDMYLASRVDTRIYCERHAWEWAHRAKVTHLLEKAKQH